MDFERKKTSKRSTNGAQFELLLEKIQKYPTLGEDYPLHAESRYEVEKKWEMLAKKLNAIGPPYREPNKWRKIWTDLRGRTKKKVLENLQHLEDGGDYEFWLNYLSSVEKKVDNIYGFSKDLLSTKAHSTSIQNDAQGGGTHMTIDFEEIIPKMEVEEGEFEIIRESLSDIKDNVTTSTQLPIEIENIYTTTKTTLPTKAKTKKTIPRKRISSNKKTPKFQEQKNLKQQLRLQKKSLKVTKKQKNIAKKQLIIFSKIADEMVKQTAALEKQAKALTGIFEILKNRKL